MDDGAAGAEVVRGDDDFHALMAGLRDEREELFDGGIADGHAADRDLVAVDEDVAAEARAASRAAMRRSKSFG